MRSEGIHSMAPDGPIELSGFWLDQTWNSPRLAGVAMQIRCGDLQFRIDLAMVHEQVWMLEARDLGNGTWSHQFSNCDIDVADDKFQESVARVVAAVAGILEASDRLEAMDIEPGRIEEIPDRDALVDAAHLHGVSVRMRYGTAEWQAAIIRTLSGEFFHYDELIESYLDGRYEGPGPLFDSLDGPAQAVETVRRECAGGVTALLELID